MQSQIEEARVRETFCRLRSGCICRCMHLALILQLHVPFSFAAESLDCSIIESIFLAAIYFIFRQLWAGKRGSEPEACKACKNQLSVVKIDARTLFAKATSDSLTNFSLQRPVEEEK